MEAAQHQYRRVWISHAVMGVAGTISVILRIFSRRKTRTTMKGDDWLIFVALLFMWSDFTCTILGEFINPGTCTQTGDQHKLKSSVRTSSVL